MDGIGAAPERERLARALRMALALAVDSSPDEVVAILADCAVVLVEAAGDLARRSGAGERVAGVVGRAVRTAVVVDAASQAAWREGLAAGIAEALFPDPPF